MNDTQPPVQSLRSLVIASSLATLIAGFVLTAFVLPAEYGIDPTGIGRKLGLTVLAETNSIRAAAVPLALPQTEAATCPESNEATNKNAIAAKTPDTPSIPQWQDSVKILVPANQGLEYKFHLQKDATLEYSWTTDGAKLYFDFHGEPKGDTTGYFKSYKVSTHHKSSGTLTAPFEGSHGWYWENNSPAPITIILNTKGSYRVLGLM
ncbi:hypothetical protein [Methylomarinum vadi]|uniref:hypothetical protein n=1 Tax=Methylomarinum vadi TaxID=438855 RepID=UPI0004DEE637|nr:hypothetical protein [Methylomarinum vadi]